MSEKKHDPGSTGTRERLLSVEEVADLLGLQPKTIYGMVSEGRIPCYRISSRCVRFRWSQIEAWLEGMHQEGRTDRVLDLDDAFVNRLAI